MKITKMLMTGAAAAAMVGASASGAFAAEPDPAAGSENVGAASVTAGALGAAHDNLDVNHLVPDTAAVETIDGSGATAVDGAGLAVRGVSESPDALSDVATVADRVNEAGKSVLPSGE
ncbi:hypothetical protein [Streptomyces sp. MZ04]|uniref:hypothetical protein n=1 Tax=Streptomyces sp. MZ04 TaxID=2559236 RepID=UPI00107EE938|nr:hypothetical protein [Streptomyces sp. MZ04]TGA96431.1 hypothetical protein E2651_32510 [Streptomyces sp. MZ04]